MVLPPAVVGVDRLMAPPAKLVQEGRLASTRHPGHQDPCHDRNLLAGRNFPEAAIPDVCSAPASATG
ncbi:hypothetical protein [Ornithinimicrobium kibberense]|uniref:hypothetical protein n=1 Tax=Ornithinimicrobium kibberense TaxID=282060 RepID=UPI003606BCFE